jgi:hypothetical protein
MALVNRIGNFCIVQGVLYHDMETQETSEQKSSLREDVNLMKRNKYKKEK